MDRRSFLRGSAVVAVAAPAALASFPAFGDRRVSCETGDPGERLYAEACGDGKRVRVFLDGQEQKWAITADEAEGFVKRHVRTPGGNMAFNQATGEAFTEIVHGTVLIEIA